VKTCGRCGGRRSPSGSCWSCAREASRRYHQTPEGKAKRAWLNILYRTRNRNGLNPTYARIRVGMTRAEFLGWALPAFREWMAAHPGERPSVDRVDGHGHYELGNLRILSVQQNRRLRLCDRNGDAPAGMSWCGACKRYLPVDAFNICRKSITGRAHTCKACRRVRRQAPILERAA
jgi:hypothetical protein